ncbi:hypothetical protein, partial [Niastella populi]|uniref:hypothetical protein n=1 Tax=Niastella populi TaxID=550983 RepID=UPI001A98B11F
LENSYYFGIYDDIRGMAISDFKETDYFDKAIKSFYVSVKPILDNDLSSFQSNLNLWDLLIEKGREHFGDVWGLLIISTIAAGIKSKDETYEGFDELTDSSKSLCKRVRCARLKSGNISYWKQQIEKSKDIKSTLLILFTWSTAKTISQLVGVLNPILNNMEASELMILINGLRKTVKISQFNKTQQIHALKIIEDKNISGFLMYILSLRFPDDSSLKIVYKNLERYPKSLENSYKIKLDYLIGSFLQNP